MLFLLLKILKVVRSLRMFAVKQGYSRAILNRFSFTIDLYLIIGYTKIEYQSTFASCISAIGRLDLTSVLVLW